jgi:hypothetical protein
MWVFGVDVEPGVHFLSSQRNQDVGDPMARWKEPGYINFERRNSGDPLLEAVGVRREPGEQEFIMVCGMGTKTVWIRWYGQSVEHARVKFRDWLAQPWQCLTTDLYGNGVPNNFDFKPSRIDSFGVID